MKENQKHLFQIGITLIFLICSVLCVGIIHENTWQLIEETIEIEKIILEIKILTIILISSLILESISLLLICFRAVFINSNKLVYHWLEGISIFLSVVHTMILLSLLGLQRIKLTCHTTVYISLLLLLVVMMVVYVIYLTYPVSKQKKVPSISDESCRKIICQNGEYAGGIFECYPKVVIGKDAKFSQIILNDESISRKHVEIIFDDRMKMFKVTDYSKNGTFVLLEDGRYDRLEPDVSYYLPKGVKIALGNKKQEFMLI